MTNITVPVKTLRYALVAAWLVIGLLARGATTQTEGSGSAVAQVDLAATFDSLTSSNGTALDNYGEGGLRITTSGQNWGEDPSMLAFDPFHGANGVNPGGFYAIAWGNNDWVTIETTTSAKMFGVEFMYGNGWTTGNPTYPWGNDSAVLEWQTWYNGGLISAGTVGGGPLLEMGTVVGFSDPGGFDQLLVRSTTAGNGSLQSVALDNLSVQTTVPEPAACALFGGGLLALAVYSRLRKGRTFCLTDR